MAATDEPKRVLVVTASVGAGHTQAAAALMESLRDVPGLEADRVDVLDFVPRCFRLSYAGGYALMVTRLPWFYGVGFAVQDHPDRAGRALVERPRLWVERQMLRRFQRMLLDRQPDLIVHTHFLSPPAAGRLIRTARLGARQFVVVTDIRMHRFWYSCDVDHWFAPAEPVAERLGRWGIGPERVTVSGIPVLGKWTQVVDREEVLRQWRLPADRRIVLLAGGAEFTCGPVVKLARRIAALCEDAYVVVIAGRNKKLLGRLACLPEAPGRLVGVAFTDRLHELVDVCSLMITKAGGVTTAECLARATPMLLMKPVPGQEAGNAEYLAARGAARVSRSFRHLPHEVADILSDPATLARLSAGARALHRPAAETIAAAVRRTLGR